MLSGLTNYLPETALTVFDNLEFFIRIVLAAILSSFSRKGVTSGRFDVIIVRIL